MRADEARKIILLCIEIITGFDYLWEEIDGKSFTEIGMSSLESVMTLVEIENRVDYEFEDSLYSINEIEKILTEKGWKYEGIK
ncbi:hypothetical protein DWW96_07220 [Eubacterium sp. AF17-7]|jgi:acyl carrier protein|uniref:hypothetical protein n=1 Tax=Eubacterium sp. AF17-7 TaxID=2293105 RepID=UPI000E496FC9|nr:hypothetical protein [Eubacterium sp. AF17-7]RGG65398.1 hypothetical protein DWW96_07220 [Eubacterium sp. AF17-7]